MGARRDAREIALKCLHQWDQRPDDGRDQMDAIVERFTRKPDAALYCRRILDVYFEHSREIDELIDGASRNWRLDRIALVDRSILRLAVTELFGIDDVPAAVTIDEAIELAKLYSTERSGAFVHGLLDRIRADLEKRAHGSR